MPKFDGTGPRGMGPKTGRGFGPCGMGMGMRHGCGFGMGCFSGCPFCPFGGIVKAVDQKDYLKDYLTYLEDEINEVKKALGELTKKS